MKQFLMILSLAFGALISCDSANDCVCIEIYAPVCGSDGIVYSNSCHAECAGVSYIPGSCQGTDTLLVRDMGPIPADGCGFLVELDSVLYHPVGLDSTLMQDSLYILAKHRIQFDFFSCGLSQENYAKMEIDEALAL